MTTLSDLDVLSLTIYGEARGESLDGKAAVANVVRNRLQTGRFGRSYESVCLSPFQFSCWIPQGGAANHNVLKAYASEIGQGRTPDDPVLKECYWIAQGCQSGALRDNTEKSTHYFVTNSPLPKWARGKVPVVVIGHHSLFNDIA